MIQKAVVCPLDKGGPNRKVQRNFHHYTNLHDHYRETLGRVPVIFLSSAMIFYLLPVTMAMKLSL